ncbi:MAG: ABC transporter ATP-binding protein/permease [Spirochaetota bacterium]|jgi:subfamily B ATP-binding cassette protein MsbA|nr:ABC transporter ATP-binding protein/permease [Spirochaetota bacterium]
MKSAGKTEIRRLARAVAAHTRLFWTAALCILVNAAATLAPAEWGQYLVGALETKQFDALPFFALLAFIIIAVKEVSDFLRRFTMDSLGYYTSADLQRALHDKILLLPMAFFRKNEMGALVSRATNDIAVIRQFLTQNLSSIIKDPLVVLLGAVMLFLKNWIFTLELLAVGILIALSMQFFGNRIRRVAKRVQGKMAAAVVRMQESLFAIDAVKLFHREDYHRRRYSRAITHYLKLSRRMIRLDALGPPVNEFLSFMAAFIIVGSGVMFITDGTMQPSELVAFVLYLAILAQPLNAVTNIVLQYKKAAASTARVFEILDEPIEDDTADLPPLPPVRGDVEFRGVSFYYQTGTPVLRDITLRIAAGETLAIVGASGCGKTTLVNLIARLYHPQQGNILIDGHDIARVSLASLREQIGYVPQENFLFAGTARENILYGRPEASDAEVIEAARLAFADEFIERLPKKYHSRIGERGQLLSGGQKQRLALARVFVRRPRILILDEATSALDAESEKLIQKALDGVLKRQTTIIIAHRLSTVRKADRVIVLDDGRIAESGTHAELMARAGSRYAAFARLQN